MHPKIDHCWELEVVLEETSYDVFVGEFDGAYHLLGYRPQSVAYLFSSNECSSDDLGVVRLPEGKVRLSNLVKGDVLHVEKDGRPTGLDGALCQELPVNR